MMVISETRCSPVTARRYAAQAVTVFLALIGTTLACINTGARVTYAMGRDEEVPQHFGLLHGDNLTPHRAIWTLATISAVLGAFAALFFFVVGRTRRQDHGHVAPQHLVRGGFRFKRNPV